MTRRGDRMCNQEVENGFHSKGPSSGSRVNGGKRKTRERPQLFMNEKDFRMRLQEVLYTPEYIFTKIFRKDGPPLGDQFDNLPSNAFPLDSRNYHHDNCRHAHKKRKVPMHPIVYYQTCCGSSSLAPRHGIGKGPMTAKGAPFKKHGMGKGLMTEKGATVRKHGIGKGFMAVWPFETPDVIGPPGTIQKKSRVQPRESIARKLANRKQAKRKASLRCRKAEYPKVEKRKQPCKEKCDLALEYGRCHEYTQQLPLLVDDEELELRELQAESNPLSCCSHFPDNGSHVCSLCKDLLVKFPPNSVTMKPPLSTQPWASSPKLVNKLFKAYHFLCTYAVTLSIHSFTLDEFVQAFHDKNSLLLAQVHLAFLSLLLSDVDKELSAGVSSRASKNCKFLHLLCSLKHHGAVLEFWQKSLNPMTWTEIMRQAFVAAGFGSKFDLTQKAACNKEVNLMEIYGLSPGTLKGELFSILLTQGNSGMKVSELAKFSSIAQLNLTDTILDLENLITSCLLGDITLFEKISSSGYRLRVHASEIENEECLSDSEDFGSVDEVSEITGGNNANDSENESRNSSVDVSRSDTDMLGVSHEIDESHPGEAWLLALMEGEYSDLRIEEKLNALNSLIDLLSAGSSFRMEGTTLSSADCHPNECYGSGAKIKKSTAKQCITLRQLGSHGGQSFSRICASTSEQPIDSLITMSRIGEEEWHANMKKIANQMEDKACLHSMQSVSLGSDRRYNRYWLLLGPCDDIDPGHRRIYFESSEDGHWEMIETKEALHSLLSALDRRGVREAHLVASLERREAILGQEMSNMTNNGGNRLLASMNMSEFNNLRESSLSPISDVDNQLSLNEMQNEITFSTGATAVEAGTKAEQLIEKSGHSEAFDAWIWKLFYSELNTVKNGNKAYLNSLRRCDQCQDLYWREEKHCRFCHTTFELDFGLEEKYVVHSAVCQSNSDVNRCRRNKVLSSQLQALKAAIYAIESAIPEDALLGSWKRSAHKLWVNRLRRASTLREFLQVLADFATAINEEWLYQNKISCSYFASEERVLNLSSIPQTYSAAALWLVKLDLLISSSMGTSHSQNKSN